jgi:hypothetical protein
MVGVFTDLFPVTLLVRANINVCSAPSDIRSRRKPLPSISMDSAGKRLGHSVSTFARETREADLSPHCSL